MRSMLSVESIETHIAKDREELAKAQASGDEAKARTTPPSWRDWLRHHPGEHKDPTSLEVHCESRRSGMRVYDD